MWYFDSAQEAGGYTVVVSLCTGWATLSKINQSCVMNLGLNKISNIRILIIFDFIIHRCKHSEKIVHLCAQALVGPPFV